MKTLLQDAANDYHYHRQAAGIAHNTRRSELIVTRSFITVVGNIYVENVTDRHIDQWFAHTSQTRSANTRVLDHGVLSRWFAWCASTKRAPRYFAPMAGRKPPRKEEHERRRVHVSQFPALLDTATHPRDRIVLALGLYLFLRASEVTSLRVRDVDLAAGTVNVNVHKGKRHDVMPVSTELASELRRWLTRYTQECGPLNPDWWLCPAKTPPTFQGGQPRLKPDSPVSNPQTIVHRALIGIGWTTDTGGSTPGAGQREGVHTLRRSGARALYDTRVDNGGTYDGAIRVVQAMLHHKSVTTTEHYIGLDIDIARRNDLIAGNTMYPALTADNVVSFTHGDKANSATAV